MFFDTVFDSITKTAEAIFKPIGRLVHETHLVEQVKTVDFGGLFSNPWFLVPFIALIGYLLYKQAFRDLIILVVILGVWYASGTSYMQTLVVGNELSVGKILPVLFGGAAILGFLIYLLFGRSD